MQRTVKESSVNKKNASPSRIPVLKSRVQKPKAASNGVPKAASKVATSKAQFAGTTKPSRITAAQRLNNMRKSNVQQQKPQESNKKLPPKVKKPGKRTLFVYCSLQNIEVPVKLESEEEEEDGVEDSESEDEENSDEESDEEEEEESESEDSAEEEEVSVDTFKTRTDKNHKPIVKKEAHQLVAAPGIMISFDVG